MKQPVLIIFICLLITVFIAKVFTWPKFQEYSALRHNAEVLQKNLKDATAYFNDAQAQYDELQSNSKSELDKIDAALPREVFVPELFNHYQTSAQNAGMILESVASGKEAQDLLAKNPGASTSTVGFLNRISSHAVNVSLTGSYSSFKHFLYLLERSGKLVDISSFEFTVSGKPNMPVSFGLSSKTYSLK